MEGGADGENTVIEPVNELNRKLESKLSLCER